MLSRIGSKISSFINSDGLSRTNNKGSHVFIDGNKHSAYEGLEEHDSLIVAT